VKKKITTGIRAIAVLIIAENILALRNIFRILIKSVPRSVGFNGGRFYRAIGKRRDSAEEGEVLNSEVE
jgi:hypothetical protein